MRSFRTAWAATIMGLASRSIAADDNFAPHTMGIFADAAATQRSLEIPSFQPRSFYVVAVNNVPMEGWWGFVDLSHPGWTVMERHYFPQNAYQAGETENHIVGLGACFAELPTQPLVRYTVGWFQLSAPPTDLQICLKPAFNAAPDHVNPGYSNCAHELIAANLSPAIGPLPAGCLVVNPVTTVSEIEHSWGAIKAAF